MKTASTPDGKLFAQVFREFEQALTCSVVPNAGDVIETHEHAGEFKEWVNENSSQQAASCDNLSLAPHDRRDRSWWVLIPAGVVVVRDSTPNL